MEFTCLPCKISVQQLAQWWYTDDEAYHWDLLPTSFFFLGGNILSHAQETHPLSQPILNPKWGTKDAVFLCDTGDSLVTPTVLGPTGPHPEVLSSL